MQPQIKTTSQKKLIGRKVIMSMAENKTAQLWQSFMPQIKNIKNRVNNELISMEIYNSDYFKKFNPAQTFEKWAVTEVSDISEIPDGMESFIIEEGLYAMFIYKGTANNAADFFKRIFNDILPSSGFDVDNRPHFAVMGDKYKNNDPESEEEIWIPVRNK
ncbi:MAG: GyrI-like domain-containing protein [Bacteroidia bacterium]|nr:GyrI-like domain-containing protein [Bacteroidia bacterium]